MNTLMLMLRGVANPVMLFFDKYDDADKARERAKKEPDVLMGDSEGTGGTMLRPADETISDDYGNRLTVNPADVIAAECSDTKRAFDAQIQMALMQQKAQSDPKLRLAQPMMGSPGHPGFRT